MDPVTPVEPTPPSAPQFDPPRKAQMMATGMWVATGLAIGAVIALHAVGPTRGIILAIGGAVVLAMNAPLATWILKSMRAHGMNRRFVVYLLLMLARLSLATWVFVMAESGRLFAAP